MCGIAGIVGGPLDIAARKTRVEQMIEAIRHRGPDGGGVTSEGAAAIGMARLAIVDIAGGLQPMFSDDLGIALVFNGEIYNAPALRERLRKDGVTFHTRSDTEVILRLYERDPERIEDELVGMWAFAIHDRKRRRVLLSRDRFGIKPLFLADTGNALCFASELRSLLAVKDLPGFGALLTPDPEAAHAMVAWAYVPEDATIFRGVKRLPPAHRLELDLDTGRRTLTEYWRMHPSAEAGFVKSLGEACELVEPALVRAVREHLESDVPIATFLSGGIDSSLVTALAAEQSPAPLTAFSIGFREERFDESPYARRTAEKLGVAHEVRYLTEADAIAAVPEALLAYDEPFGDSSSVATLLLARTVARTHKVALGGDGGDEVFAGYRKHQVLRVRSLLEQLPGARPILREALRRLPAPLDRTTRTTDALRTLRRLERGLDSNPAGAWVALTQVASLERSAPLLARPASGERFLEQGRAHFERALGNELQRTLACDLGSPLANDMLTKVDRATMAVSLEARVPFLDHRVAELGVGLPAEFTLTNGKRVLRELHRRRFGAELADRPKKGFGVPVEGWLSGSLSAPVDHFFDQRRLERFGLLAPDHLSNGKWRAHLATDGYLLWHALALAVWCEATLGDGPDAVREAFAPPSMAAAST
jgi:asparagine synthase (glutamine-hydrolysing)